MDHANAPADGLLGVKFRDLFALHEHLPGGGSVDAVQDVHQGGLSGAVLAHEGEDLALVHGEAHVVIGPDTGEFHTDVGKLDDFFHAHSSRIP